VLQITGSGLLLVSSFGAIHRRRLAPGERYVVDTGHLVAVGGIYALRAAQGFNLGLVPQSAERRRNRRRKFTGPGEILIRTGNLAAFAGILKPFFPTQSGGGGMRTNIFGE
jgi:uncharacterized protein (AIM24 family)